MTIIYIYYNVPKNVSGNQRFVSGYNDRMDEKKTKKKKGTVVVESPTDTDLLHGDYLPQNTGTRDNVEKQQTVGQNVN